MVSATIKTWAVAIAATLLGAVVSLFTAGPALFADGAYRERLLALGISVVAYAILGMVLGAVLPVSWRLVAVCAWAPLVVVLVLFGREALQSQALTLLLVEFALGDAAAVLAGSLLGARLRFRRYANR